MIVLKAIYRTKWYVTLYFSCEIAYLYEITETFSDFLNYNLASILYRKKNAKFLDK